jgi:hypothetical protein
MHRARRSMNRLRRLGKDRFGALLLIVVGLPVDELIEQ